MKRATLKRMSTVLFLVIDGERGGIAVSSVAEAIAYCKSRGLEFVSELRKSKSAK